METQEIEVTIDRNGNVQLHVRGVKGTSCKDLTRDLEEALGGEIISSEATAEMYDAVGQEQQEQTRW